MDARELHGQTILVVEDDDRTSRMFRYVLEFNGYRVLVAEDADNAVAEALEHAPDLVLMDIMLGNGDGYSACSRLKEGQNTCDIPVIFVTALAFQLNDKLARELGAEDYLVKPVPLDTLLEKVAGVLDARPRHNPGRDSEG